MDSRPELVSLILDPEEFVRVCKGAELEHLCSLTPETAAGDLEDNLERVAEYQRKYDLPPPPNPLPEPSLAVLLADGSPGNRWPP